ncbi:hypothetical protein C9J01_24075 [Photobacterium rosenbergii]|uniref:Adhesin n=1 Tax=Photobacterium rosenbergii TaxID=294936 RepID=A0A2T3N6D0_9GAMM|nr:CS1 type fimbrial major subunit [Photobacterium rosenbergii]PSW08251.1 hypothetical protein C9J01_24075 [Photobacterium rosenbergii]
MFNNKNIKATHRPKAGIATSLILAVLASSGTVMAASGDRVNKVINLSATIPSASFSINPLFGTIWPGQVDIQYDENTNKFIPYAINLEAKSMVGVTAHLQQDSHLMSGSTKIPLTVSVNNIALSDTPQGIVENTQTPSALETHQLELKIEQETAATTYDVAGIYSGIVNIVFEDEF